MFDIATALKTTTVRPKSTIGTVNASSPAAQLQSIAKLSSGSLSPAQLKTVGVSSLTSINQLNKLGAVDLSAATSLVGKSLNGLFSGLGLSILKTASGMSPVAVVAKMESEIRGSATVMSNNPQVKTNAIISTQKELNSLSSQLTKQIVGSITGLASGSVRRVLSDISGIKQKSPVISATTSALVGRQVTGMITQLAVSSNLNLLTSQLVTGKSATSSLLPGQAIKSGNLATLLTDSSSINKTATTNAARLATPDINRLVSSSAGAMPGLPGMPMSSLQLGKSLGNMNLGSALGSLGFGSAMNFSKMTGGVTTGSMTGLNPGMLSSVTKSLNGSVLAGQNGMLSELTSQFTSLSKTSIPGAADVQKITGSAASQQWLLKANDAMGKLALEKQTAELMKAAESSVRSIVQQFSKINFSSLTAGLTSGLTSSTSKSIKI